MGRYAYGNSRRGHACTCSNGTHSQVASPASLAAQPLRCGIWRRAGVFAHSGVTVEAGSAPLTMSVSQQMGGGQYRHQRMT